MLPLFSKRPCANFTAVRETRALFMRRSTSTRLRLVTIPTFAPACSQRPMRINPPGYLPGVVPRPGLGRLRLDYSRLARALRSLSLQRRLQCLCFSVVRLKPPPHTGQMPYTTAATSPLANHIHPPRPLPSRRTGFRRPEATHARTLPALRLNVSHTSAKVRSTLSAFMALLSLRERASASSFC